MSQIHIVAQTMTDSEYDRERAKLRATYGDSRAQAGARWEQELATLFYRSGWTQERLARKEHKGQSWVSKRVIFGRYLAFSENNPVGLNLTEWRFRSYWECTGGVGAGNERQRFAQVTRLMQADTRIYRPTTNYGHGPAIKSA